MSASAASMSPGVELVKEGLLEEPKSVSDISTAAVCVKEERECDGGILPPAERAKAESELDEAGGCGASEGLYAEHEVKGELVLSPERLQPQDITYTSQYTKNDDIKQETAADWSTIVAEHPCPDCLKKFESKTSLNRHKHIHKKVKRYYYKCEICTKQFVRKCTLTKHIKTHMGETYYTCEVCQRNFMCSTGLLKHRQIGSRCWFQGT